MRVDELVGYLKHLYKRDPKTPIILLGPSEIEMDEIVRKCAKELAQELGRELIGYTDDVAQRVLETPSMYFLLVGFELPLLTTVDLVGVFLPNRGFYPMQWARCLSATGGILFFNKITEGCLEDVLVTVYKIMLDRKVGEIPINDNTLIIAAGSPPEDFEAVYPLPTPLLNRCKVIRVEP